MTSGSLKQDNLISAEKWLQTMDEEYLTSFVTSGGSCVRFLSGESQVLDSVSKGLEKIASSREFHFVQVNPGDLTESGKRPDFHKIEKFYFRIAETIDWKRLSGEQVVNALRAKGINFPTDIPIHDYHKIASVNGLEPPDLLNHYARLVTDLLLRDLGMAAEFRFALTALGRAQLSPDELTPTTEELLCSWLRGEKAVPGAKQALERVRIHERISSSNARFFLESLFHWLMQIGKSGTIVVFDFRPYERVPISKAKRLQLQYEAVHEAIGRGAAIEELKDLTSEFDSTIGSVQYSPAAYIQALELLRHFIDGIERMAGLSLVVFGTPDFFDNRPDKFGTSRRYRDYDALQTRIGLEVSDVEKQNPSAALVHLGGS